MNAATASPKGIADLPIFTRVSDVMMDSIAGTAANMGNDSTVSVDDTARLKRPYTSLAMLFTAAPIGAIIFVIIFGNALVIVAVLRDSHLKRQPQNWLILSLAAADLLVGLLIMPLTLMYELLDAWILGDVLCELWLALDVLFVTASILNLCAISLDRYWSLTIPTSYPQRRTPRRMLLMIMIVWLSAFAISFPPLVGWRPDEQPVGDCVLSDQLGYVLYSALGSFYVPVLVLLFVYSRIYFISRRRKKRSATGPGPDLDRLSWTSRFSRVFTRRQQHTGQDKRATENHNDSKTDLLNGAVGNGCQSPMIGTDYAAVIARVRAIATLRRDSVDRAYQDYGHKMTSTSSSTDIGVIAASEISSGDGLSHVMAIAAAAASYSRQGYRSESIAAKAYELQSQLRQRRKLVRRRERQATVVLGLVLGSFVISWMPFFCSYLLSAICCKTPAVIFDVIFWLGYCNSAFNPIIYNFFNRDFRRAFSRILCDPINRRLSSISSSLMSLRVTSQKQIRKRQATNTVASASENLRRKRISRLLHGNSVCSSFDNEE